MKELDLIGLRGGYTRDLDILKGVDLDLFSGEFLGIVGVNGCGKTTLAKAIVNSLPRRTGRVICRGEDVSLLPTWQIARKGIILMPQGGAVFPNLSVFENLRIAFKSTDKSYLGMLRELIPILNMPEHEQARTLAGQLSGGERHQLALAMVLAERPSIAVLDEPSAGLSPKTATEIYGLLTKIRREIGFSAIIIEQNISKVIDYCERIAFLAQGQVAAIHDTADKKKAKELILKDLGL